MRTPGLSESGSLCSVYDEYVDLEGLLPVRDMRLRGMFG